MTKEMPEFSRLVDSRKLPQQPVVLDASKAECAALAERFGLVGLGSLHAQVSLTEFGDGVDASGRLVADLVQSCAVTGEDLPVSIDEEIAFRFVPEKIEELEEEIELEEEDLDEIAFSGTSFDLGEAVAQSLALAIDPYATGPGADRAREEHGLAGKAPDGPLQRALGAALKKD